MSSHPFLLRASAVLAGALLILPVASLRAEVIEILNAGFEMPAVADKTNVSFDGVHGSAGPVPGWKSNEPSAGGVIRVDDSYPGRTGNNVLYLHGTGEQCFFMDPLDVGEDLQSNTTYVLCFDVLRWANVTLNNTVILRAGLYTGPDYWNREVLKEFAGPVSLVDKAGNPVDKVTLTLVVKTGEVAPGTQFWIGGDLYNNASDAHRPHLDQFRLYRATEEP